MSGSGDGFVAVSATSGGFGFQRGVSYVCSVATTIVKCTVVELGAWDRLRDGPTNGQNDAELLNALRPL